MQTSLKICKSMTLKCLRGLGRLWPSVAPDTALAMAHPPAEEFLDLTDLETEFFSELEPDKIFSSLGNIPVPLLPRETRTPFSTLVKDLISLTLIEKNDVIEGLFVLPRLTLPNNMRGRTVVVSKVHQNIGLFRKGLVNGAVEHAQCCP